MCGIIKNMYNITIVCFCYKGDEDILPYSLKAAENAFNKNNLKICLVDDGNNPISNEMVDRLKNTIKCEFVYEISHFERNRNLNGKECIENIVDRFIQYSNGRDGLVIKLDPDTMILKRDLFDNFMYNMSNSSYIASTRPGCHFSGICYCIKTGILKAGRKMLNNFNIPLNKGPEDYIIGLAMSAASIPQLSEMIEVWHPGEEKSQAVGWNYSNNPPAQESIDMYYNMFDIVTFGNWFMYKNLTPKDRIKPMEMLLETQKQNILKM